MSILKAKHQDCDQDTVNNLCRIAEVSEEEVKDCFAALKPTSYFIEQYKPIKNLWTALTKEMIMLEFEEHIALQDPPIHDACELFTMFQKYLQDNNLPYVNVTVTDLKRKYCST